MSFVLLKDGRWSEFANASSYDVWGRETQTFWEGYWVNDKTIHYRKMAANWSPRLKRWWPSAEDIFVSFKRGFTVFFSNGRRKILPLEYIPSPIHIAVALKAVELGYQVPPDVIESPVDLYMAIRYPLLWQQIPHNSNSNMWSDYLPRYLFSNVQTLDQLVTKVLGKRATTKAHKKYIAECILGFEINSLSWMHVARSLVPRDYLLHIKTSQLVPCAPREFVPVYRAFLRNFPPKTIVKFINNNQRGYFHDSAMMWTQMKNEGHIVPISHRRDMQDIHDLLQIEHRRWMSRALMELEIPQKAYKDVDKVDLPNGLEIVTPKTGADLIEWGAEMNNCIASYVSMAAEGHTLLLGVKQNGKMIANAQITGGRLAQLYGPHNEYVSKDIHEMFRLAATSQGLITERR